MKLLPSRIINAPDFLSTTSVTLLSVYRVPVVAANINKVSKP